MGRGPLKTIVLLKGGPAAVVRLLRDLPDAPWAARTTRMVVHAATSDAPVYNAVIELWSDAALHETLAADALLASAGVRAIRPSHEVIGKPGEGPPVRGTSPGIAQLSLIRARADLDPGEVARHWAEHITLANGIHVGMNRYVQDHFRPGGVGDAPWFGMAHLHFPDAAALHDGLFRSPEDVAAITADVAEFVAGHATLSAIEHVLKG